MHHRINAQDYMRRHLAYLAHVARGEGGADLTVLELKRLIRAGNAKGVVVYRSGLRTEFPAVLWDHAPTVESLELLTKFEGHIVEQYSFLKK